MSARLRVFGGLIFAAVAVYSTPGYFQYNLVSDLTGMARFHDPNLQNPWGMSQALMSPIWVSDNGKGLSTLYSGNGSPVPLVVSLPNVGQDTAAPTGQVFNGGTAFNGDRFIFATEQGTIDGWRGALGTNAESLQLNPGNGAVYKGLALATIGSDTYLYAADFHNNAIHVIKSSSGAPDLSTFTDPALPGGYAPFNIQLLHDPVSNTDKLYVAYAKQGSGIDEAAGPGFGYVSEFNTDGTFVKRLVSNGPLNAPWGMAIAPSNWGPFSGDLLVGNFGDGTVNAFNPDTGTLVGTLRDRNGNPIVINGLWGLMFGTGQGGKSATSLYFTAGLNDEANGLFGTLRPVPEPATVGMAAVGGLALFLFAWRRRTARIC